MEIFVLRSRVFAMIRLLQIVRNAVAVGLLLVSGCEIEAATFEDVNKAFGLALFVDEDLWDERDADVANRLNWPRESETPRDASYRLYAADDVRVLDARPYSLALYGEGGLVSRLSLVFANKGDFEPAGGAQFGEGNRLDARQRKAVVRELGVKIKEDADSIVRALSGVLGEPRRTSFGQGRETREQVLRWDWSGHSFLLAAPDGDYVALRVVPTDVADGVRKPRITDKELRSDLANRVERRPHGDVVIKTIPMVNQGPKGFCVPATWERAMRYMGIPADMYVLAMAGDTGLGRGTYLGAIIAGARETITRAGRRLENTQGKVSMPSIVPQIDRGIPIMWAMFVDEKLNLELVERSQKRLAMTDPISWSESLKECRKAAKSLRPRRANGHMCMIIGYNKTTGEIAISDSWGDDFAERWICLEEAEALSQRTFMTIQL